MTTEKPQGAALDWAWILRRTDKVSSTEGHHPIFESYYPPLEWNPEWRRSLAFGGGLMALALHAAAQTIPTSPNADTDEATPTVESVMGHFLGGANSDSPVTIEVETVRATRSFHTRAIKMSQVIKGSTRKCFYVLIDFSVRPSVPDRTMSTYDRQPDEPYTHHSKLENDMDRFAEQAKRGDLSVKQWDFAKSQLATRNKRYLCREAPEGVLFHNNIGTSFKKRTPQSSRPLVERRTGSWCRFHGPLIWEGVRNENQQPPIPEDAVLPPTRDIAFGCFLLFIGDELLPALPVFLDHRGIAESANCNTLSFAVHFHSTHLAKRAHEAVVGSDAPQRWDPWILRELKTDVGREERSYGQGDFWEESADGQPMKLIMTVVQKGVLRSRLDTKL